MDKKQMDRMYAEIYRFHEKCMVTESTDANIETLLSEANQIGDRHGNLARSYLAEILLDVFPAKETKHDT